MEPSGLRVSDAPERLGAWRQRQLRAVKEQGAGEQGGGDKGMEALEFRTPSPGVWGRDWCLSKAVRADSERAIES